MLFSSALVFGVFTSLALAVPVPEPEAGKLGIRFPEKRDGLPQLVLADATYQATEYDIEQDVRYTFLSSHESSSLTVLDLHMEEHSLRSSSSG
jgi:hypothetical protein